ncbi:hypothetical protein [Eubacterium oxidoreducens]|uniref:PemK-like, MazF-like toxin of type II toxin-antitoxin system n=1 Tax=Eubacterium oxidoreducens TaxID=1732 RepID=A0A1G6B1W4_EUBOX|nr:hypothetical protein [Eubacterium oxidoreducens]SDB14489.1 hypothetical protein SAMN02910417_01051 [Eubacterium oxidoreducens]
MNIEIGQIITLRMRVNNSGTILNPHPYLVLFVNADDNYIEIAQVDSLKNKEYKALKKSNKIIYCDAPLETVIDKDSFIQLDNCLRIEYFDDICLLRRQEDKLSDKKFQEVIRAYIDYQNNNYIDENKQVYVSESELKGYNSRLNR